MNPLVVVVGGVSVVAIGVGLALAGVVEHVSWWLSDQGRRRRARRRHGYVNGSESVR